MTSLEKAINLGYLFLTFNPPPKNPSIHAPLSSACIGMFQFIQRSIFDLNTCTLHWAPITGTFDFHKVNFPIWGWNNSGIQNVAIVVGKWTFNINILFLFSSLVTIWTNIALMIIKQRWWVVTKEYWKPLCFFKRKIYFLFRIEKTEIIFMLKMWYKRENINLL